MPYSFEPEWEGTTPRSIADNIRFNKVYCKRRNIAVIVFLIGLFCFVMSYVPFVYRLGDFIHPLHYLEWIGGIVAALGFFALVKVYWPINNLRYLRNGIPLEAEITHIEVMQHAMVENVQNFSYNITAEVKHPETDQLYEFKTRTDQFPVYQNNVATKQLTFNQGDSVTACYLPGNFEKTVVLYSSLGLKEDIGLVNDQFVNPPTPLPKVILYTFIGLLIFSSIVWALYILTSRHPIDFPISLLVMMVIFGLLVGLPIYIWAVKNGKMTVSGSKIGKAFRHFVFGFGFFMFGAIFVNTVCGTLNTFFDNSNPEYRLIQIDSMKMTTHNGVVSTYEIEYFS